MNFVILNCKRTLASRVYPTNYPILALLVRMEFGEMCMWRAGCMFNLPHLFFTLRPTTLRAKNSPTIPIPHLILPLFDP